MTGSRMELKVKGEGLTQMTLAISVDKGYSEFKQRLGFRNQNQCRVTAEQLE